MGCGKFTITGEDCAGEFSNLKRKRRIQVNSENNNDNNNSWKLWEEICILHSIGLVIYTWIYNSVLYFYREAKFVQTVCILVEG